jgi:putative transposase
MKTYTTDLSDAEWACLKNHLPASKLPGKMRTHALREIFDAIFYVLKSGCPLAASARRLSALADGLLPFPSIPPEWTVARIFTILRAVERKRNGKDPNPSAAIMDSQSIKTTEESADWKGYEAHSNGYDAHKYVKGRKRHLLVDTLGLPLSIYVTPADVQDRVGARLLLAGLKPLMPRLKKIWADGAYGGDPLAQWCHKEGGWELQVVERNPDTEGFEVIPKRWIVERTLSWIGQNRRMARTTSGRFRQARLWSRLR